MIKKMLNNMTQSRTAQRQAELYRDLIRHEARIGGQLFGEVPAGVRREFFCLDKHTWVWHEEWTDQDGQVRVITTRYDIRPNGIIKSQNGNYQNVSPEEGKRLYEAAKIYLQRVEKEVYAFAV